jgi:lipoprotein signal peptidase
VSRRGLFFWGLVVLFVGLDQGSKIWAFSAVGYGNPGVDVISGIFQVECNLNRGVTFGWLSGYPNAHIITAALISAVLVYLFYSAPEYTDMAQQAPPKPEPKKDGKSKEDEPIFWTRWHDIAIGCILSGAIGNMTDRIYLAMTDLNGAAVRDFIKVYVGKPIMNLISPQSGGWWPTFNIADAFIVCGVILYIALFFVEWRMSVRLAAATAGAEAKPKES